MTSTLIIPGLRSSGPAHWQSWFETQIVSTVRVIQPDWTTPDLNAWSARIRRDITRTPGRLYIVAHSFGALAAVQAANNHATRIAGALLVAPADPDKFGVSSLLPALDSSINNSRRAVASGFLANAPESTENFYVVSKIVE